MVTDAIGSKFDRRAMTINDILEYDVKFASMVIGYRIYYSNRDNFVSKIAIYVVYEIIKENKKYDLCELLQSELIKNLKKIKENKKHPFKYETFILCLFFYFMNEVSGIGQVQWAYDRPVGVQIRDYLYSIGDYKVQNATLQG